MDSLQVRVHASFKSIQRNTEPDLTFDTLCKYILDLTYKTFFFFFQTVEI